MKLQQLENTWDPSSPSTSSNEMSLNVMEINSFDMQSLQRYKCRLNRSGVGKKKLLITYNNVSLSQYLCSIVRTEKDDFKKVFPSIQCKCDNTFENEKQHSYFTWHKFLIEMYVVYYQHYNLFYVLHSISKSLFITLLICWEWLASSSAKNEDTYLVVASCFSSESAFWVIMRMPYCSSSSAAAAVIHIYT